MSCNLVNLLIYLEIKYVKLHAKKTERSCTLKILQLFILFNGKQQ